MATPSSEKVHELLQSFHTAMLVTHASEGGELHARPMEIAEADAACHVWCFSDGTSAKTHEIRQEQQVILTFQKDHQKYLALTGTAHIVTDRAKIESLWKETYRVWFPEGVDNPRLTLLHIIPQYADYWDNSGIQGVRYLYEAGKALLTGTAPGPADGDAQGHVTLG